jgi:precorrin-6A/cobalt-precorrin-6A reductase
MAKVLILGGTKDARVLAGLCVDTLGPNTDVITSLAGRTKSPQAIAGTVRVGGFGGADGLGSYIQDKSISVLVDATHPFANTISKSAALAARNTGTPYVMIERPRWALPTGIRVTWVSSLEAAVTALRELAAKSVFITTGINGLDVFSALEDTQFVIRQIEDHEGPPPVTHAEIVVQKPPFDLDQERETMTAHNIDALVTKESGGGATEAKLEAASELGIPVVMIERPALPAGETVSSPQSALDWISRTLRT